MRSIHSLCLFVFLFLVTSSVYGQESLKPMDAAAPPQAVILGRGDQVCRGDSLGADITFLGDGPFDAVINDNQGEYMVLTDVTSPQTIWLKPENNDTYYIASVTDRNDITGTTQGSVPVTVLTVTPVDIILDQTAYFKSDPGVPLISNPTGGVFTGNGIASNVFYPSIAGTEGSPHLITCTFTNFNGCVSRDTEYIQVIHGVGQVVLTLGSDTVNVLCDDNASYELRASNLDNEPGDFQLFRAGQSSPVTGHIVDGDLLDNTAVFDPAGLSGAYDVVYTYRIEELTVRDTLRLLVNDLEGIKILGLPGRVCKNDSPHLLTPDQLENDPGAVYMITGPGVSGNQADGFYFVPSSDAVEVGNNKIELDYTSSNGCRVIVDTIFRTNYAPDVNFIYTPSCLPLEGGTVEFTNMTSGKFSVESWNWDFGDPESGNNNTSNIENPVHYYGEASWHRIRLTATTKDGCVAIHQEDTAFADQPLADFTWLHNCYVRGNTTAFVDRSITSFAVIDTFTWTFKTSKGGVLGVIGTGSAEDTVRFPFTSLDNYLVELQIMNQGGCADKVTKEINLKPSVLITEDGYLEDFNGDTSDWFAGSGNQLSSWVRGTPDFTGFEQVPGDRAWYTDLPADDSSYLEHSWIESPCLDFSGIEKPLIQLDLLKSFSPGLDGAILQYHQGTGDGWKTLGNVGQGINWYNVMGIYNEPGGSNFGWGLPLPVPDRAWVNARNSLDVLAGYPNASLRITVATGRESVIGPSNTLNQGFAFDNLLIAERTRLSVLEYFTNSASPFTRATDAMVDKYARANYSSVIDLQYHMEVPGPDPMNLNNPYPVQQRANYNEVQGPPFAVLNGGPEPDHRFDFSGPENEPNGEVLKRSSLEIPLFKVNLDVNWTESSLDAQVDVTCVADTFAANLQLYLAVVEHSVTTYTGDNQDTAFRNVVLAMLPGPQGALLGSGWGPNDSKSKAYTWPFPSYIEDLEELGVVAWVQERDENRNEILQAAVSYRTPHVGLVSPKETPGSMQVYPNPARDHLFVRTDRDPGHKGQLRIMDISGKLVMNGSIHPGYDLQRIDVSQLPQGVYLIYWIDSGIIRARNKLVLTR